MSGQGPNERLANGVVPRSTLDDDGDSVPMQINVPAHLNTALLGIETMLRRQLQLSRGETSAAELPVRMDFFGDGTRTEPGRSVHEGDTAADIEAGMNPDVAVGHRPPLRSSTDGAEGHEGNEEARAGSDDDEAGDTADLLAVDAATRVELRSALRWLEQALPFLFLLLLVFIYQHRAGIITFVWLTVVLYHMNTIVKKQVSRKQARQVSPLVGVLGILFLHIACTYFLFRMDEFWRSIVFVPPMAPSFWDAVWIVVLNDLMVRYVSMALKALAIISIGHLPPFKRRAQLYAVIEITVNLYRTLLPVTVWFAYLIGDQEERIFSSLMAGMYLIFKINGILSNVRQTVAVVRAYMLNEVRYGKLASQAQVLEVGDQCAICQEKMKDPIVLQCGHIFCDDCVSRWFEREKTCPLCRTVINTAGYKTHSDGSTPMSIQLF